MPLNVSLPMVPQNRIRAAYNRAQYWDERVNIMEWGEGKGMVKLADINIKKTTLKSVVFFHRYS